ncbi:MAG: HAMP domain-containing protein [Acidobacteria bacterium]|nr:HAMP domain-containing protein [Acidobacteriota bacterium]
MVPKPQFNLFRSVRNKLLILMITLSLLPLLGMSVFSYLTGRRQIHERIRLSLVKMAQDTADKLDLLLGGKREEIHSMATTYPLIYQGINEKNRESLVLLLNNYCFNSDVYDLLIVLDKSGRIVGINTVDRNLVPFSEAKLSEIIGQDISRFPEEQGLFAASITGHNHHQDWYQSKLVQKIYQYGSVDRSHRYNIALSEPIRDPRTREVVGVWINILNWSHFQAILDNVEMDLADLDLRTGYSFMTAKDADTIIGHKYRSNRYSDTKEIRNGAQDFYHTSLTGNYGLRSLHNAIRGRERDFEYDFQGSRRLAGLAAINDLSFGWIIGVEVDESDVFRPVKALSYWLIGVTILLAVLVVFFTYVIAGGITVPLKIMTRSASRIAQGNLDERVPIRSSDELGMLAATFNDMAQSLSVREIQLQELNKNLENMVRDRTLELENSHEALKRAYLDLQSAQEQLVQTEKMASLGQLVSGIAHEIKNPLNFIYGNTGFLADYTAKLQQLVESFERLPSISDEDRSQIARMQEEMHYGFIKEDLKILIDNFTEGARRINTIVTDLRTFSRMDTDTITEVDLHAALEMSLNLLRNQYKNRIEIHKEYGEIPKILGYSGKLNQVFMNLLSNAFHAIQGNGDVWIRTRLSDHAVEVEIQDNGAGIPKENLSRIFEPFFTTKPVGQGTGLGLSISYGIIEQHRGRIIVTSEPMKGSSFVVRLPVDQEKPA